MAQINTRIILRNDSTLNWAANENVVLLKGEVGIEFIYAKPASTEDLLSL